MRLVTAALVVLLLLLVGCEVKKKGSEDPTGMKAPMKVWVSVVPGLPLGSTYRLGGWYRAYYVDPDPYDALKNNVIIWCTWLAVVAGAGILGSFIMRYYKIPFATDVLVISGIGFIGSFLLALIVQYMTWIIIGCAVGLTGYIGYVFWRELKHKMEKEEADRREDELITTTEIVKPGPSLAKDVELAVMHVQSDDTIEHVKAKKKKAKERAVEVRQKLGLSAPVTA